MNSSGAEALEQIWRIGGKASISAVARAMGISSDYARIILFDIGKKDYIDIARTGICKITETGKEFLKNRGILKKIKLELEEAIKRERTIKAGQRPKIIQIEY